MTLDRLVNARAANGRDPRIIEPRLIDEVILT